MSASLLHVIEHSAASMTSTAGRRRSASWSLFQVIDDLLISHRIYRCLHSSVCITCFSHQVYWRLKFCQTWWKLKDCTPWCKSLSVTRAITLLREIQAAGTAASELTLQLDDTKLAADDCIFKVWHQNCCSISQNKLKEIHNMQQLCSSASYKIWVTRSKEYPSVLRW